MARLPILVAALSLSLASPSAFAQSVGDTVRIETPTGAVEGVLIDRLPQGYLINQGTSSAVIPYVYVRAITRLAPAAAPSGPAVQPAAGVQMGSELPPPPPPPGPPPPPPGAMLSPIMVPVPALPEPPRPMPPVKYQRRSKALMGTGIGMVALGGTATLVGLLMRSYGENESALSCENTVGGQHCVENKERGRLMNAGEITTIVGAVVAVVGIPLWAVGGTRVRVEEPTAQVSVGPASAALTVRF